MAFHYAYRNSQSDLQQFTYSEQNNFCVYFSKPVISTQFWKIGSTFKQFKSKFPCLKRIQQQIIQWIQ